MSPAFEDPIVAESVKDDPDALAFLRDMAGLLHWFDDVVDRDHPLTEADAYQAIWTALISLPRSTFYRTHFEPLNAILANAIISWRIANGIERNPERNTDELRWAFVIRSAYVDLLVMAAMLVGGADWAVECGPKIRRWAHGEGLAGYLIALDAEAFARRTLKAA